MSTIVETNYFGNFTQDDEPKSIIIPVPYEYTPSFNKGTKNGPQAILNASTRLEKLDDELWKEISSIGINTTGFINCEAVSGKSKEPFKEVEEIVRNTAIGGCVPVLIGGERSITYGSIKAVYDLFPDISVLYLDAKTGLKNSVNNNKYNHQCTLKRIQETMPDLKITQIGIRSVSKEEADWLESNDHNIEIYFAKDKNKWMLSEMLSNLTKNVYITFNFNVFDSGIMPSCIAPEPGGLSWEDILGIIRNVCAFKEIVGMDFVEYCPIAGLTAPDFTAAKLIYKTLGYTFARQLGVFEEEKPAFATSEQI